MKQPISLLAAMVALGVVSGHRDPSICAESATARKGEATCLSSSAGHAVQGICRDLQNPPWLAVWPGGRAAVRSWVGRRATVGHWELKDNRVRWGIPMGWDLAVIRPGDTPY